MFGSEKKKEAGYLSAKESRRISKENRKITQEYEKKRKRKNVDPSEYACEMRDPSNAVEFDDVHTYFFTDTGVVKSVDGVSYDVPVGKTVGVVGESGCGKSVTCLSLIQLLQRPQGQVTGGSIRLNLGDHAIDVTKAPEEAMQKIRGSEVSADRGGHRPPRRQGLVKGADQGPRDRDDRDRRHRQLRGRLRDVPA